MAAFAAIAASSAWAQSGELTASGFQNGKAAFVVSDIGYALSKDATETGACPDGMTSGYRDFAAGFIDRPDLHMRESETAGELVQRVIRTAGDPNVRNLCMNPELSKPDQSWRVVTGQNVPVEGIDLDGQDSHVHGKPAPATCAHDDFRGMNGERGIDNQFFRVVGCGKSYQPTGESSGFATEMLSGAWGILLTLEGVGNLQNADHVEVGIYASADPIQLSATRVPLPYATYSTDQDPRFRTVTRGRIVNGVLTTDPVDVRFRKITNSIWLERSLSDARLRLTFATNGGLEGILAGYTSVEDMYDFEFGFRNGKDAKGGPAPLGLRSVSSVGYAVSHGLTCEGAYYALKRFADGHRDPRTGQCTAISTQYRIKLIPAFVGGMP